MKTFLTIATTVNVLLAVTVYSQNTDRFNYIGTVGQDYGPYDWERVSCDDLAVCEGWPDEWVMSPGWTLGELGNQCGPSTNDHPQGPINLERATGISDWANTRYKECIDVHWMKYYNGGCNWEDMTNNPDSEFANNFFIRRHALQIMMPLGKDDAEIKCPSGKADGTWQGADYAFPKLDYSKGFPEWWQLVQTNIKTPSDYTQDGTKYDAQLTYHMFYELPYELQSPTGPRKRDGEIVIFLQAYNDVGPDPLIDKFICQFRKTEDKVREDCGLDSVPNRYPGCYNPSRRGRRRNLRSETSGKTTDSNTTAQEPAHTYPDTSRIKVTKEDQLNFDEFLKTFDFDEFIQEQINMGGGNGNWDGHPYTDPERHLLDYLHVPFHHFGALMNVRTEYYHRLVSSQLVPPCQEGVHVRAMKDPLRIHPRQLKEIQRLLAERIAPLGSTFDECQVDSAGRVATSRFGGPAVELNRPLTNWVGQHKMQFCECKDWPSKWPEDRKWCGLGGDKGNESPTGLEPRLRYFEHPYNYYSEEDEEWTPVPYSPPTASPAPSSTPTILSDSPTLSPTPEVCLEKKDYCYGLNESSRCCSGECKEDKQECG